MIIDYFSGKKFSFGNKPFKPHTPDRKALAKKLLKVQTTPDSRLRSQSPVKMVGVEHLVSPSNISSVGAKDKWVMSSLLWVVFDILISQG